MLRHEVCMRLAVVGHTEWVEFVRVDQVPRAGEIARGEFVSAAAAGGGAVAAVQFARWGADCSFFTAVGGDALGQRVRDELAAWGVTLHAVTRAVPQRRALTMLDRDRERTIVVFGERAVAHGGDPLPWAELGDYDAVFVTGGDAAAVRAARAAKKVVSTPRILPLLRDAGIELDALVGSAVDQGERYAEGDLDPRPLLLVQTQGAAGGFYVLPDGVKHTYRAQPAQVTGDTYGAGDTFAAGITFALAEGLAPDDAVAFAAARAAEVVAFEGPYPPRVS